MLDAAHVGTHVGAGRANAKRADAGRADRADAVQHRGGWPKCGQPHACLVADDEGTEVSEMSVKEAVEQLSPDQPSPRADAVWTRLTSTKPSMDALDLEEETVREPTAERELDSDIVGGGLVDMRRMQGNGQFRPIYSASSFAKVQSNAGLD